MFPVILLSVLLTSYVYCQNVTITLYYETLCPDSARFIEYHLYPAWSSLKPHLILEWIPFGKATQAVKDGEWIFHCQHGRRECDGNKLHACVLEKLTSEQSVDFIQCSMLTDFPPDSGPKCAKEVGANFIEINDCFLGNKGTELLSKYGNKTLDLDPILNRVPTYTINGKTTDWDDRQFLSLLCSEYLPTVDFCIRLSKN